MLYLRNYCININITITLSTSGTISRIKILNFYTEIQILMGRFNNILYNIKKTHKLSKCFNKSFTKERKSLVNPIQYNSNALKIYDLTKKHKSGTSMHSTFFRFNRPCHKLSINIEISFLRKISLSTH